MKLNKKYVETMRDHAGDYVDSVEELADDWLEMKKTLEWIKKNSKEDKVIKRIEKLLETD